MSIKYLSPSGLTEVWSNIKTYIASKIPSKIITGLSIKGRTITYTNSDGTTGTLTTQDTNTTYDSMSAAEATTGTATTARSISAKVLHDKITNITNTKANDADVVHKSGTETIVGTKTFSNDTSTKIILQNTRMVNGQDDTVNRFWSIALTDKNNGESSRILRFVNADNSSAFQFYEHYKGDSKNQVKMGVGHTQDGQGFVTWSAGIKNNTYPLTDNTYTLGTSTLKWKAVYATTYYGNLVGGLTLNQATLKMTVKDSNSETTRTKDVILANSSNTDYGINVAFGGSGNTVVGAGESYTAQLNELVGDLAENLYLTADNNIYFKPGANTFANAKTVTLSSAAELSGLAKVTSTSFVGALTGNVTGNADTATKATQDAAGNVITTTYAKDTNVVHKSGNETIGGLKTFSYWQIINMGLNVKWITGHKEQKSLFLFASMDDSYKGYGAELQLHTETLNGGFNLIAKDKTGTNIKFLSGNSNGSLTWDGNVICSGNSYLKMTNLESNTTTPTSAQYKNIIVVANDGSQVGNIQFCKRADGSFDTTIYSNISGSNDGTLRITSNNEVYPLNNKTKLGNSTVKWSEVWATTFNGNSVVCTGGNAFLAQNIGYTFLIRNDGSNTYFLMSDKDGTPGTWSTARPLIINNATGVCNINGNANTATYATTQATSDNSTKIATTAWVRTYVNSVVGSGSIGATITAYWGSSSSTGDNWARVSGLNGTKRVSSTTNTFTPVVGQIYSGNQLYNTATANGSVGDTGAQEPSPEVVYARLDLSGAFNSSYKYLCTTAVGVNATASVDVTGHTQSTSSGPYTTITSYTGFTKAVYGGKSTFLRVQ